MRIYWYFGKVIVECCMEECDVKVDCFIYFGEKFKKSKKIWDVFEVELLFCFGVLILLVGFVIGGIFSECFEGDFVGICILCLVIKLGNCGFLVVYLMVELENDGGEWCEYEIYIVLQWEVLFQVNLVFVVELN